MCLQGEVGRARSWRALECPSEGQHRKALSGGDDRVKFAPTAGVLALLVVSLSRSFLPGEMEIMISTTVRAVGFGLGQPWVQVFP